MGLLLPLLDKVQTLRINKISWTRPQPLCMPQQARRKQLLPPSWPNCRATATLPIALIRAQADVKSVVLVCKAWHAAVQHQLRTLTPLYLPPTCAAGRWLSLDLLQLPLVRSSSSGDAESSSSGGAGAGGGAGSGCHTRLAPLRCFASIAADRKSVV